MNQKRTQKPFFLGLSKPSVLSLEGHSRNVWSFPRSTPQHSPSGTNNCIAYIFMLCVYLSLQRICKVLDQLYAFFISLLQGFILSPVHYSVGTFLVKAIAIEKSLFCSSESSSLLPLGGKTPKFLLGKKSEFTHPWNTDNSGRLEGEATATAM